MYGTFQWWRHCGCHICAWANLADFCPSHLSTCPALGTSDTQGRPCWHCSRGLQGRWSSPGGEEINPRFVKHWNSRRGIEDLYLVHIARLQGTEHNCCLVPYVFVLHVQSMILIDGLPSRNWKYMVNILGSGDDDKLSLTVNGAVNDVSIRQSNLHGMIIILRRKHGKVM